MWKKVESNKENEVRMVEAERKEVNKKKEGIYKANR